MPSFDVVSEVDQHEVTNAVDQTNREVSTRFDFKGANAKVSQQDTALLLEAESDFQIDQMRDILLAKMAKRGLDIQCIETRDITAHGNRATQTLNVRQGIDKELGKKMVKLVKNTKLKVQASIQGEQVRVSGKKRDDLQQIITMFKDQALGLPLQFTNFRD